MPPQDDPEAAPLADFVRASMSVPLFFRPFVLPPPGPDGKPVLGPDGKSVVLPEATVEKSAKWEKANGYEGALACAHARARSRVHLVFGAGRPLLGRRGT